VPSWQADLSTPLARCQMIGMHMASTTPFQYRFPKTQLALENRMSASPSNFFWQFILVFAIWEVPSSRSEAIQPRYISATMNLSLYFDAYGRTTGRYSSKRMSLSKASYRADMAPPILMSSRTLLAIGGSNPIFSNSGVHVTNTSMINLVDAITSTVPPFHRGKECMGNPGF
jgi:hypothetical protein